MNQQKACDQDQHYFVKIRNTWLCVCGARRDPQGKVLLPRQLKSV